MTQAEVRPSLNDKSGSPYLNDRGGSSSVNKKGASPVLSDNFKAEERV